MKRGVHVVCHTCPFEGLVRPHRALDDVQTRAQSILDGHETVRPDHNISKQEVDLE